VAETLAVSDRRRRGQDFPQRQAGNGCPGQGFYNSETPQFGHDWTLHFQLQFLFPKKSRNERNRLIEAICKL
jgi:hypothetical protein